MLAMVVIGTPLATEAAGWAIGGLLRAGSRPLMISTTRSQSVAAAPQIPRRFRPPGRLGQLSGLHHPYQIKRAVRRPRQRVHRVVGQRLLVIKPVLVLLCFTGQPERAERAIQMQENSATKATEPPAVTTSPSSSKPTAITTLTRGAGVVGGLIGGFFALVALATPVLKIAGLVACICVGWATLQVAHERDRGRLANSLLIWLSASGASTLLLIILLAGQTSGSSASAPAGGNSAAASSSLTSSPSTSRSVVGTTTTAVSPTATSLTPPPAAAPDVTWLADLQPVVSNEDWTIKPVQVKGVTYNRALSVEGKWCDSTQVDYVLGGQYSQLKAMVGMVDNSPETRPLTFYVLADGKPIKKISEVGIANPQPVELSVAGVSRLAIGIESLAGDGDCPGPDRVGVWIDPSLTK